MQQMYISKYNKADTKMYFLDTYLIKCKMLYISCLILYFLYAYNSHSFTSNMRVNVNKYWLSF